MRFLWAFFVLCSQVVRASLGLAESLIDDKNPSVHYTGSTSTLTRDNITFSFTGMYALQRITSSVSSFRLFFVLGWAQEPRSGSPSVSSAMANAQSASTVLASQVSIARVPMWSLVVD
ncbi:hypothetical protein B0H13DRAFT_728607 [Mycena leptocephala]|nr:hypothetical protein B0H13DRAFT_728607 [Mycena leptocephala]